MTDDTLSDGELDPEQYPFAHPEAKLLLAELGRLIQESDRGAVLVGASHIENQLEALFRGVAPKKLGRSALKRLFGGQGALGTFSSRIEVAVLCGLIPKELGDSIHGLRKIRNDVAHSPTAFRLADHEVRLREIYDIGPGVSAGLNRLAVELMVKSVVRTLVEAKSPLDGDASLFESPGAVIDYLRQHPEHIASLDEDRPRWEWAFAVSLICAMIIFHRELALKRGVSVPVEATASSA